MDCQYRETVAHTTSLMKILNQVVGCLIGLVVLIGVGVGVGITISKNKPSSSSDDDSTAGVVTQTNPNDPSTFIKDPALIQSFYGIAYTPEGSQYPQCGNSLCEFWTL